MSRAASLLRAYGLDALIVAAALESALEVAVRHDAPGAPQSSAWFAVPAIAFVVLGVLARRRFAFAAPAALWLLSAALSFVDGRLVTFPTGVFASGMAAALLLGNLRDEFQARIGLAIVLSCAAIVTYNDPTHAPSNVVFIPALFAIAWVAGFAMRERAAQAEAAEERAHEAERERETTARIAVAEERARIARELHDIVAHAVSVMVLQVGAVRHKLPESVREDKDALKDVEDAGRNALNEMRRLLGAMRNDSDDLELAPQPGLGSIDALLNAVRGAGLPVQLHVEGSPTPLPRALDLSAYRIIQESLTNVLKHARASRAEVEIRYGSTDLQIDVRDNGDGATGRLGVGHGLVGIGERVKIYGGELTTGSAKGGGFVISARLPFSGASA